MTKLELANRLAANHGITKVAAKAIVDDVATALCEELYASGHTRLHGFGSFDAYRAAERPGFNPHSGEPLTIPASMRIRFRPVDAVKQALNA